MRDTFRLVAGIALATTLIAPEVAGGIVGDVDRGINSVLHDMGVLAPGATVESAVQDYGNWIEAKFRYGRAAGTRAGADHALRRFADGIRASRQP